MPSNRYSVPEVVATLNVIDREGEVTHSQACVTGVEIEDDGSLQLDFRELRPIRLNDRGNLTAHVDLAELLASVAKLAVKKE